MMLKMGQALVLLAIFLCCGVPCWADSWRTRGEFLGEMKRSKLRSNYLLKNDRLSLTEKHSLFSMDVAIEGDWSPKLRSHFRGEALHLATEQEAKNRIRLIEGGFQYELTPLIFLDFGKTLEEWGSGYAFNPVNVLLPPKKPSNPTGIREGATMVKLEILWEAMALTAILSGVAHENNAYQTFVLPDSKEKRRFAFKWDHSLGEVSLSWVHVQGGIEGKSLQDHLQGSLLTPQIIGPLYGVSWTTILGDALEVHGEYAVQQGRDRFIPQVSAKPVFDERGSLVLPTISSYQKDNAHQKRWLSQFLLGGQYTFENGINLIGEWLYHQSGYTNKEWKRIRQGIQNAQLEQNKNPLFFPETNPFSGFLSQTLLQLQHTAFRQNYGFLRVFTNEFGARYESESIVLMNLNDASFLFQEKLSKFWQEQWKGSLRWITFQGKPLSEYGLKPHRSQFALEVSYQF